MVVEIYTCWAHSTNCMMDKLTEFQRGIVKECIAKKRGCLSVPMGSGKTLMALALSTTIGGPPSKNRTLVVCAKTLIESWVFELNKFLPDLTYEVYQSQNMSQATFRAFQPTTEIIITTPDVVSAYYKKLNVFTRFVAADVEDRGGPFPTLVNRYWPPKKPIMRKSELPGSFLFSTDWKFVFVDEIQEYTNILSTRCQAIASLYSPHKWALSGTPFNEPVAKRILGFYMILGDSTFPNCMPDAESYIRDEEFAGTNASMVVRTSEQVDFELPEVSEHLIQHDLTREERDIYSSLKTVTRAIKAKVDEYKRSGETNLVRTFSAYLLAMITMTRMFLVCPLVPFASMIIDTMSIENRHELAELFKQQIEPLDLKDYLADPNSCKSSRIQEVCNVVDELDSQRIVIFTCFRVCLQVIAAFLDNRRRHFVIEARHSPAKRAAIINEFCQSPNGILLMTYDLGAQGLNLQKASAVLLVDVWWNSGKTKQAEARLERRGQEQRVVKFYFTSNTGIEKGLLLKHGAKNKVCAELARGPIKSTITKLRMKEILALLTDPNENAEHFRQSRVTH